MTRTDRLFYSGSLLIGQMMTVISTFFWNENGRHTPFASVLIILSMVLWAYGFVGMFSLFRAKNPWYARLGFLYAFYGCLGGIGFGFEGLYSSIFDVADKIGVEAYAQYPLTMNLVLFWSGPAFPLTLLIFGVMYIKQKHGPWWVGFLIALGGAAFPPSRITRFPPLAHAADVLLLVALALFCLQWVKEEVDHEVQLV